MGTRGVGIRDVARAAGVSTTTVSHAMSGKGRLPEETRERVRRVAEEMGYRPSAVARSLAAGRTGVLGIAFSLPEPFAAGFLEIEWYTRIVNAATQRAMDQGYALVVVPPVAGPEVWGRLPLDGAIVVDPVADDPNFTEIRAHGVRLVSVGRPPGTEGWYVDNDNAGAVRVALDHLRAAGAGRVGLVCMRWSSAWHDEAVEAYRAWCAERGADPIVLEMTEADDRFARYAELLAGARRPDGLLCLFEPLGVELAEAARLHGVGVPADLRLVAAGDEGIGPHTDPPLTTIDFDPDALGDAAAAMLIELIEGREPPARVQEVPARLVARASSGASA